MRRMRSDARCRRRRAVSEGKAVARELGGGGHGGSALVRPERERESEMERDSSGARLRRSRACSSAWHWGRTRVGKLRPRGNGGSALRCLADTETIHRARGVRRS